MTAKLPYSVVHYGHHDPRTRGGGLEIFARRLGLVFEDVQFMTPESRDINSAVNERLVIICDNHLVLDWPEDYPVIGFQHGVAVEEALVSKNRADRKLANLQKRAASRPNTLWVACAEWIGRSFEKLHGNGAKHVVYHLVDVDRFDGDLDNSRSRLVLHDARTIHKGKRQIEQLARALPKWHFESLSCSPRQVPDRMRQAAAFVHLSQYEGNSIVCNEAMAMDLPCLFTRVGLMRDEGHGFDVEIVDVEDVYGRQRKLVETVETFLDSLTKRLRNPRTWVLENASLDANLASWKRVMVDHSAMMARVR